MKDNENQVFDKHGNHDFPTEIMKERLNNTTSQSEKIVYGSLITSTKCYNCIHFPLCFAQKGDANLNENDCCYYQPKLPKNSVVLSKEEYERITKELVTEQRATEIAKEYFEKIRKETAEKIYTFINSFGTHNWERFINFIKQFGVEI